MCPLSKCFCYKFSLLLVIFTIKYQHFAISSEITAKMKRSTITWKRFKMVETCQWSMNSKVASTIQNQSLETMYSASWRRYQHEVISSLWKTSLSWKRDEIEVKLLTGSCGRSSRIWQNELYTSLPLLADISPWRIAWDQFDRRPLGLQMF